MAAAIDGQARAEQAALIVRVGHGDLDAFRDLSELYARPMHRLAWRMLFDTDEAQQVVRDAFARLWTAAPRWRAGDGRVGGWLYGTCTRLCLERLRRRDDREIEAEDEIGIACLAALSGRSRAAIVLTRCEALPNETVAEILGMRLTAFELLLSEARTALHACLRQSRARVEPLNQLLEEIRPVPLPPDFAARIAVEAVAFLPMRHDQASPLRRGVGIRNRPILAGIAATGLLAVSAFVANGELRRRLPGGSPIDRVAARSVSIDLAPTPRASPPPVDSPSAAPDLGLSNAHVVEEPAVAANGDAQAQVTSTRPAPRLALVSASKTRHRKARVPRPPIDLLPPGFANLAEQQAQGVEPKASAAEAQRFPGYASYAELAADRRARMRDYLRGLSPDELKQLRREERAVRRERRRARESGLAQIGPDRR